jgi:hypothetical protein
MKWLKYFKENAIKTLKWLRFFGCGSFILFICIFTLWIEYKK